MRYPQRIAIGAIVILVGMTHAAPLYAEGMEAGKALSKLARGGINVVTGWVEVPKRINETAKESGMAAGLTWGLLRGLGHGFVRTVAGFYEVFTFPVPAPSGYAPVIQPEYVFTATETE